MVAKHASSLCGNVLHNVMCSRSGSSLSLSFLCLLGWLSTVLLGIQSACLDFLLASSAELGNAMFCFSRKLESSMDLGFGWIM